MTDVAPVPRLILHRQEAADALGMSFDSFERHVQPYVRIIRLGRMRFVAVAESRSGRAPPATRR